MKGFILDYINENEYKKLERALKKYNMLAFKKLNFEYYPSLRNGKFLGELMGSDSKNNTETYELKLPSDHLFTQVHGEVKVRYIVYKDQNISLDFQSLILIIKNICSANLFLYHLGYNSANLNHFEIFELYRLFSKLFVW